MRTLRARPTPVKTRKPNRILLGGALARDRVDSVPVNPEARPWPREIRRFLERFEGDGTDCCANRCHRLQSHSRGGPMPFDSANFVLSPEEVLQAALSTSGLKPVEPRVLALHMSAEVRRHPPGLAYRHQRVVELVQVAVLVTGVVLFVGLFSADHVGWGAVAALAAFGSGILPMLVPTKGPARWRERVVEDLHDVPAPIRDPALRLRRQIPEVNFVVGELYQDRIRLDPYLLVEYGDARAIVGIWDGDRVIAGG
jgi:hypothetical protein